MSTSEIILTMLEQMAALEDAGCRLVIRDEQIGRLYTCCRDHEILLRPDKGSCLLAVGQDKNLWVRLLDGPGGQSLFDEDVPLSVIGKTADLVNRQAGFVLSHPAMFAGCEMEF